MEAEHAEPVAEMASLNVVSAKEAASVQYVMDVAISSVKSVRGKVKSSKIRTYNRKVYEQMTDCKYGMQMMSDDYIFEEVIEELRDNI